MKVSDVIGNSENYIITRSGTILAINNGDGIKLGINPKVLENEVLNMDVLKVQKSKGLYADYDCIRV